MTAREKSTEANRTAIDSISHEAWLYCGAGASTKEIAATARRERPGDEAAGTELICCCENHLYIKKYIKVV